MAGYRIDRITEDIKRELIHILREVKDPRVSDMLSVVKVNVSNDLSYAKIYVSSVEGIEAAKESVKGLKSASGFIRKRLSSSLHLRKTPELKFIADDSIEKGFELFDKLKSIEFSEEKAKEWGMTTEEAGRKIRYDSFDIAAAEILASANSASENSASANAASENSASANAASESGAAEVNSWEKVYAGSGSNGGHAERWGKYFYYEVKLKRSYDACMQVAGTLNVGMVINNEKYHGGPSASDYLYVPSNGNPMLQITAPAYVAP